MGSSSGDALRSIGMSRLAKIMDAIGGTKSQPKKPEPKKATPKSEPRKTGTKK